MHVCYIEDLVVYCMQITSDKTVCNGTEWRSGVDSAFHVISPLKYLELPVPNSESAVFINF
jgi:hypothetical protein